MERPSSLRLVSSAVSIPAIPTTLPLANSSYWPIPSVVDSWNQGAYQSAESVIRDFDQSFKASNSAAPQDYNPFLCHDDQSTENLVSQGPVASYKPLPQPSGLSEVALPFGNAASNFELSPENEIASGSSSRCTSHCGTGDICRRTTCDEEGSQCDQDFLLQGGGDSTTPGPYNEADAAAVLTAIGTFHAQLPTTVPPGFSLPPDVPNLEFPQDSPDQQTEAPLFPPGQPGTICPKYLTIVQQHIVEAHDLLQPTCAGNKCPLEDSLFNGQCPIPLEAAQRPNMFDNVDMGHFGDELPTAPLCGVRLHSSQDMIQHVWIDHQGLTLHSSVSPTADTFLAQPGVPWRGGAMPSTPMEGPHVPNMSPAFPVFNGTGDSLMRQTVSPATSVVSETSPEVLGSQCLWRLGPGGPLCGIVFSSAAELQEHVRKHHTSELEKTKENTFSCGWLDCRRCGQSGFPQKSKLERHLQVHTNFKPFQCDKCGLALSGKQALQQHKLIHSGEKPHPCPHCPKWFRQASSLTMHMRCHTGAKPLPCQVCGKYFSESSNLAKHRRIHMERGAFDCPHPGCDKNFRRGDQLRRHLRIHGGDQTSSWSRSATPTTMSGGPSRPASTSPVMPDGYTY